MTIIMWMWGSTLLYITCHTNEKAVGMVVLILIFVDQYLYVNDT